MKKFRQVIVTAVLSIIMCFSAFAGQWNQDEKGWWYQNDDGTYPVNCWQWIDGKEDGNWKCYYFNESGYCLTNTTTPDGKTVDATGALVNSTIAESSAPTAAQPVPEASKSTSSVNNKEQMVWVSRTGKKYHSNQNCSNMKNPDHMTQSDAEAKGRTPCSKCY